MCVCIGLFKFREICKRMFVKLFIWVIRLGSVEVLEEEGWVRLDKMQEKRGIEKLCIKCYLCKYMCGNMFKKLNKIFLKSDLRNENIEAILIFICIYNYNMFQMFGWIA